MSLEYTTNLAVLNLPDSIDMINFFPQILKAFYWEYDELGRKPVGVDQYLICGPISDWDRNSMKIHVSMRPKDSRFTDVVAIDGVVCRGKLNGTDGYSLSFTVEERAKFLYERTTEEHIKLLRQYFNKYLGLKEVMICEFAGFK